MARYKKKKSKSASGATCTILKKRISSATNKTTRGRALGNYARAGCAQRAKKRKQRRR